MRAALRRTAADARYRRRDFFADLRERFSPESGLPLPPARLRHRVGPKVYAQLGRSPEADRRWLDFGCGCGRVARHLIGSESGPRAGIDYSGVDVDRSQIDWAARHLGGRFEVIPAAPPTAPW